MSWSRVRTKIAVALGALGEPGLPVGGGRQLLGKETALGAHRHDDGVLDLLRLGEPQHLGAEILRPVRPAQAAARHRAEAQVHALDAGRIDEDLVQRPGERQVVDAPGVELEGDRRARLAVGVDLEKLRANRRLHEVGEAAQDAVLVEARDRLEAILDLGAQSRPRPPRGRRLGARVEAGVEQGDDPGRDRSVPGQRRAR